MQSDMRSAGRMASGRWVDHGTCLYQAACCVRLKNAACWMDGRVCFLMSSTPTPCTPPLPLPYPACRTFPIPHPARHTSSMTAMRAISRSASSTFIFSTARDRISTKLSWATAAAAARRAASSAS
eukprot:363127-Chlamydomonas_euryale.AAC.2